MTRRTRRLWTDEEKRSICQQTTAPGASLARVARRYAVNANLIFQWPRDLRYAPEVSSAPVPADDARFLQWRLLKRSLPRPRPSCRAVSTTNCLAAIGCGSARALIPILWRG
ncbi:transposase [Paracoccus sp. Z330]|uniref:Transposase n=1 Tax=Paracoccus onchidii TaxID=3017813 RepID=A0ABT4ZKS3_9RHOB|nr:transposase [Paracoccus onchidii]MDB6179603.1 transposase [Paracoccus onchidii]